MKASRKTLTNRRHRRIRQKIHGTADRPRLCVFRSNQHIYAQVIDDDKQHTLAAASTLDSDLKQEMAGGNTCEASAWVGKRVAQRATQQGIQQVVFDRGGNLYHGRVKALADAAREAGLEF
ncbi:50S ribosomal protein L18 [Lyngbya confervoides]|uniref:Large ribosomal subunit protein uL18 n=1 Tax=Lyngbya confervoides BDU141951 TaxID=1574623 RepID=A0ABD4TA43_9CYAN|nr:50S ribosomal protein L18 [Lyngbya confervoides]MCM1985319.1 50S ribosomal protein L18 [Lyngbya confervoides BDU141951]